MELYLHQLFTRLGYEAELHPDVPGTTRQPDFRFAGEDGAFDLEAAVVFSGIVDENRNGTREGWVLDAIDEASDPNFFVRIEFEAVGQERPRSKAIRGPVLAWLHELDPEKVYASNRIGEAPRMRLQIADWVISVEAFAKDPDPRGRKGDRLIGIGPIQAGYVNDREEQPSPTLKRRAAATERWKFL